MAEELTDGLVKDLEKPAKGNLVVYDKTVKGFGVRITSAGAKAFILNYRVDGRERRITIGSYPDWKTKTAREHAKVMKRQIDVGDDPMLHREESRQAKTVGQLCDLFETEGMPSRRAKTVEDYKAIIRLYIRPEWGNLKAGALQQADVAAFHRDLAKRAPIRANRMLALLSTIYSFATKQGLVEGNPTKGVERRQEERRERFLSPVEIGRLADALAAHPEKPSANAIKLLLLTGSRRGEALKAQWVEFDLEAGTWTKPSGHTKQKKMHKVPLSTPALQILIEMREAADQVDAQRAKKKLPPLVHLFPGKEGRPMQDIKHSWATICQKAGLGQMVHAQDASGNLLQDKAGTPVMIFQSSARIHDLRHSFASVLASRGLSLPVVGALLGHSQPKTTARYAHLYDDALRAATAMVGDVFAPVQNPAGPKKPTGGKKPGGNVVAFPGGTQHG